MGSVKRCNFAANFKGRLSCWHWELTYWRVNEFRAQAALKAFAISVYQIKQYAQRLSRESVPTCLSHGDVTCSHIRDTTQVKTIKSGWKVEQSKTFQPLFFFIINLRLVWRTKSTSIMDRLRLMRPGLVLKTTSYSFISYKHDQKRSADECRTMRSLIF